MTFVCVAGQRIEPQTIITAHTPAEVPDALARLQAARDAGLHAAGFFSYELGYLLDPKLENLIPKNRKLPLLWFACGTIQPAKPESAPYKRGPITAPAADTYIPKCRAIIDAVHAGEIYQANLTMRARFTFEGSAQGLYADLITRQPTPYGGIIETPEFAILSLSPELFIDVHDGHIRTRPMKGTAPRGRDPVDDDAQKQYLQTDEKQRAENLMIVDLMRNDLGRIATNIRVDNMFSVETHRTLHQMTSDICAQTNATLPELLRALLPAGSITGAPKIRAMEFIRTLEDEPRGVYCGAFGLISPNGDMRFNVAIRTITIINGTGEIGIGSGIVADSDPQAEYDECLLKMRFLTQGPPDFALIETMKWNNGYYLLDEHLSRLAYSASLLGFPCDLAKIKTALTPQPKPCAVRLQLEPDGTFAITTRDIPPVTPLRVTIAAEPLPSTDPLRVHKTTRRDMYDRAQIPGFDDVIFLNERGEACESTRMNLFIERDGILLTPPLSCGLLPGVLRAHLLKTGLAQEAVLTAKDLKSADNLYLGNALRGLVLATLSC